jgi:hypothetical protein
MNYKELDSRIRLQVARLSFEKQLALALSVCKKLFPDYQDFFITNQWGP